MDEHIDEQIIEEDIDEMIDDPIDDIDDDDENEDVVVADDESSPKKEQRLSAKRLYDIILRHPDWRVVEASDTGADYCHPLKYWFSTTGLLFQYDGAARQMKHEALCEDIIDLNGMESFEDERDGEDVYILQDIYPREWEWSESVVSVRKATLASDAKWIVLHPDKQ